MSAGEAILLDQADQVATVLRTVQPGETVVISTPDGERHVVAREVIPMCHKIAMTSLSAGSDVVKYGETIGILIADVEEGALIHLHNLRSKRALKA
ncbi:MAG: UxaA family hydrolase [Geminicoccaceae bacterium]